MAKKNPRKRRGMSVESAEMNLTPMMNLFSNLIPFLLLCASFASIKILDVNLPEVQMMNQPVQQKDKEDEGLLLTVFITDEGVRLGAKGAMLPTTFVREFHKYKYNFPKGSAHQEEYIFPITKATKKDLPLCPQDPGRRLTLYERDEILLYAVTKQSEDDTGIVQQALGNKLNETLTNSAGAVLNQLPNVGDTVYVLNMLNRRMEIVRDPAEYFIKELTLYDELASRLMRIYSNYPNVPDAGEIKVVAEDDVVFDKIIHVMDICREFGFPKISIGKLAG
ncbi:MAG: hypothetical protein A2487_06100 [Candidatus Raymondbacteria bacterium RifOxyC12_full_50_8]|uniref:Biopolymer transporter ExbD n=1 Tax=Candidatus Raymondbacteria bacterium RIFOXYD12_FULL_49_13 TaxID=1817890 RepID=A0A1F7F9R4_UNCRA|nr:MAG: hypothetical protein A2248_18645 [Candidatus Raymondbacteria bacterium RIFOXYA2_FULL_49_16]OGJ98590.1 MAG: hypothetical protein A2350_14140 [Candidatus Raymondbacteria bacterium RifOxyB12_full_50_8]OGJ99474.1 MAG: hypothetical protein A2487_06100 [Candidatus Raymondbacteria bacterium RifOxyC12_full_50_8]OGK03262.1 MAG: hypothetical protein A2519_13120 [Candidatus Raymondbacteria bacterium RIFOXYD12_FULL_49_13]OGP41535.1 MAG: hypothetical protein A2324_09640 [Candidatus Raymondbacteria b